MDTLPPETLADRIRRLRRESSLTTRDLAERMSCNQSTIVDLEAGRGNPTLRTLDALASALGTTTALLLNGIRADVAS